MGISVDHLLEVISVFCVPGELKTPNIEVSFQNLYLFTSYDNKCGNNLEETYETY